MKQLDPSHFLAKLLERAQSPIALVLHQSADPDAVGSAAALASLLSVKTKVPHPLYAEGLNRSAKQVAEAFKIALSPPEELANHNTILLVDLNNLEQIGNLVNYLPKDEVVTFCIDHHVPHSDLANFVDYTLLDDQLRATAELVLQLWEVSGAQMSSKVATLLASGIVYDSRHFHIALNDTFTHFTTLLQFGADYPRVLELLSTPLDKSERVARLKAAGRAVVYDEFGLLIAATVIGSYEASASRAILRLGADIALAATSKKNEVRISGRASESVVRERGLDLAKHVMEPLGELIGGAGGGHPAAAGANGTGTSDHALGLALQLLRKELKTLRPTKTADE